MKLLLTAFDPFGGATVNAALEAVKLVKEKIGETSVIKLTVPTVFEKSIETVTSAIEREKPDAVLCVGQAEGRKDITPERVAINLDDARIADNEGNRPVDAAIRADGDTAYFSTLPIRAIERSINDAQIPCSISNTAGTFVCNHLMYGLLYTLSKSRSQVRAGFIHVPLVKCHNAPQDVPSISLSDTVKALETAISAIDKDLAELKFPSGK